MDSATLSFVPVGEYLVSARLSLNHSYTAAPDTARPQMNRGIKFHLHPRMSLSINRISSLSPSEVSGTWLKTAENQVSGVQSSRGYFSGEAFAAATARSMV
jgi:hypothetical protein